jgi:hypothetical protein
MTRRIIYRNSFCISQTIILDNTNIIRSHCTSINRRFHFDYKMELSEFEYSGLRVLHPKDYYLHLSETFILDVYQSELLQEGDKVLDLGAATGDFCILASSKVGREGSVLAIEPNSADYEILLDNLKINNCTNVLTMNIGVSGKKGHESINFRGRKFEFRVDTLTNILRGLSNTAPFDFIKMDIEGFEYEVLLSSMEVVRHARVIIMEFHNTKEKIDGLLIPMGYTYHPVSTSYLCRKLMGKAVFHPRHFLKTSTSTIKGNPRLLYRLPLGYDYSKNSKGIFVGYYINTTNFDH